MSRRRRANRMPSSRITAAPRRRGVLIVHGIGMQKRGKTLTHFGRAIADTLSETGTSARFDPVDDVPTADPHPPHGILQIGDKEGPLLVEAHWADAITSLRGWSARRALRQLWQILRILPFVISAVLLPRVDEPDPFDEPDVPKPHIWKIGARWRHETAAYRRLMPMLWRALPLYGLIAVGVMLASWEPLRPWGPLVLAALVVAVLAVIGASSLIGQVRVAALTDDEVQPALDRIREAVTYLESHCDEIWVLAHSQGGYLTHRVLCEDPPNRHPSVRRFTGIASGLRPIHLISSMRGWRVITGGWLMLGAGALFAIGILQGIAPGGFLQIALAAAPVPFLLVAVVLPVAAPWATLNAAAVMTSAADTVWSSWNGLASTVVGASLAAITFWLRRGQEGLSAIPALPRRIVWEEATTASDVVGSMSIPAAPPTMHRRIVPGRRNFLTDHLLPSYLGRTGILRFVLAERFTDGRSWGGQSNIGLVSTLETSLVDLSQRTYLLRGYLQTTAIAVLIGVPIAVGNDFVGAVLRAFPLCLLVWITAWISAAAWWHLGARQRIRRYMSDPRDPALTSLVDPVRTGYRRLLWVVGLLSITAALGLGAAVILVPLDPSIVRFQISAFAGMGLVTLIAGCFALVRVRWWPAPTLLVPLTGILTAIVGEGDGGSPLTVPGLAIGMTVVVMSIVGLFIGRPSK